ncbi:MAG: SH3 domain-containing protein [Coriobacteriia bacterium]|jgi:hypothetical protein|nr:SH3 domain-containing protein [Coriobacteriia bacterium]
MRDAGRVGRAIAGVIVLVLIFVLVNGWWRDYRRGEAPEKPAEETTSTPEAETEGDKAEEKPAEAKPDATAKGTVVVLIEGLNFRKEPSRDGTLIRGLSRGTRLVLLETVDGWHHVKDDTGVVGYVSSSTQYTEVQQ